MNTDSKKPVSAGVFAITLGVLAVGSLVGLRYFNNNAKSETPEIVNESSDQDLLPSSNEDQINSESDNQNQNAVLSETIVAKVEEKKPENIFPQITTNAPDQSQNNDNTTPQTDPTTEEVKKPTGFIIADFEDNLPINWQESGNIEIPGYKSNATLKLSNIAGESVAAKKVFETPVLKGFTKLEFNIKINQPLLAGEGSQILFEQEGSGKWVSISDYVDNSKTDWQLVSIPLVDFTGLDTNKLVANMTLRFWNDNASDILIDNIVINGNEDFSLSKPAELAATEVTDKRAKLTWAGEAPSYNLYQNGIMIANITESSYLVEDLEPNTTYRFYVTAADSTRESVASEMIEIKTLDPIVPVLNLGNFEDNTLSGWSDGQLISRDDSGNALRLTILEDSSSGTTKILNLPVAKDHEYLELDINLNGNFFWDEDITIVFDQNGWKEAYLYGYVENGKDGWQHVKIPLSDFEGLKLEEAIAQMILRFWNINAANVDLDNIVLN